MDTYIYHIRNRYCMDHSTHLNIIIDVKNKELLHSITVTAKSSIKMKGDK